MHIAQARKIPKNFSYETPLNLFPINYDIIIAYTKVFTM